MGDPLQNDVNFFLTPTKMEEKALTLLKILEMIFTSLKILKIVSTTPKKLCSPHKNKGPPSGFKTTPNSERGRHVITIHLTSTSLTTMSTYVVDVNLPSSSTSTSTNHQRPPHLFDKIVAVIVDIVSNLAFL